MLADPFWLRKITTDAHLFALGNTECPDDRHRKLKIYVPELVLYRYEYIPLSNVAMKGVM